MNRVYFLSLFVLMLLAKSITSAPLYNIPQTVVQPNGDTLYCLASGDEFYNWLHDEDDYTIIQNDQTGYYVYVDLINNKLVSTDYVAGKVDPRTVGLQKGIKLPQKEILDKRNSFYDSISMEIGNAQNIGNTQNIGNINNLVIFIRFSDQSEFSDGLSKYDDMFNSTNSNENSMYNYFNQVSYNKLSINSQFYPISSNTKIISYQDSHPRNYFTPYNSVTNLIGYKDNERTSREHELLKNAVNSVNSKIPNSLDIDWNKDGKVDNICFIIQGGPTGWSSLLWPHKWALFSEDVRINGLRVYLYNVQLQTIINNGVLCHEMFHTLGAPDLYHYSGDGLTPVGPWDIMQSSRNPPQHMSSYMKYKYGGWINTIPEIVNSGNYSLNPLTFKNNNCYKISSPNSVSEYFLVEYRIKQGLFENSLPGSGLIVYRINSTKRGNASGPPDEVYVYRPNGTLKDNGLIWDAANFAKDFNRVAIDDQTNPSSFLSDGSPGGLSIRNIGSIGNTISFDVGTPSSSVLSVSTNALTIDSGVNSEGQFTVSSNVSWTTSDQALWLKVDPNDGTGNGTITVRSASSNPSTTDSRSADVKIEGGGIIRTVTITQKPSGSIPYLTVSKQSMKIGSGSGSSEQFSVSSNVDWITTDQAIWLKVDPNFGSGNGSINVYSANANPSTTDSRSAEVKIEGGGITRTVIVTQDPSGITTPFLTVSKQSLTIASASGSSEQFSVSSNISWVTTDQATWLKVDPNDGTGNGTITVRAASSNPSTTDSRSAEVKIEGGGITRTVNVTQQSSGSSEYLTVSPPEVTIASVVGSTGQFSVISNVSWQTSDQALWLKVDPNDGTGNGTITVRAASTNPSTTDSRSADVRIEGGGITRTVKVIQENSGSSGTLKVVFSQIESSSFPSIKSYVTVNDNVGNSIVGLTNSHFNVKEDNNQQSPITVTPVGTINSNISTAIVMDKSASMSPTINDAKTAAIGFVNNMRNDDKGCIISFGATVTLNQGFTSNKTLLINSINSINASDGSTRLFDGIYDGISQTSTQGGRKAVISLTDGIDNASTKSETDVISYANQLSIPVFTIGLSIAQGSTYENILMEIASQTGGQYYYAPNSSDLSAIYQAISKSINNQYLITFTSDDASCGGNQRIVSVTAEHNGSTVTKSKTYTPPPCDNNGNIKPISPLEVTSNNEFWVDIKVGDPNQVNDLFGASFKLNYEYIYLEFVKAESYNWFGTDLVFYSDDDGGGEVSIGVSRKYPASGANGNGIIAKVKFRASNSSPNKTQVLFSLNEIEALNSNGSNITLIPLTSSTTIKSGLNIWPGDTNNDNKVDQADVLPLGLHWNKIGSARINASIQWLGQACPPWNPESATYADCNGDGTVDQADVLAIGLNWSKTHNSPLPKSIYDKIDNQKYEAEVAIGNNHYFPNELILDIDYFGGLESKEIFGLSFGIETSPGLDIIDIENGGYFSSDALSHLFKGNGNEKSGFGIVSKIKDDVINLTKPICKIHIIATHELASGSIKLFDIKGINQNGREIKIKDLQADPEILFSSENNTSPEIEFGLVQNYPNPFNPITNIEYSLAEKSKVRLSVYNMLGEEIAVIVNDFKNKGRYTVKFDCKNLSSGVYIYKLVANKYKEIKKLTFIK
jgi:VWFA-related protein